MRARAAVALGRALALLGLVFAAADAAAQVRLEGALEQAGLVTGRAPPGAAVALDGRTVRVSPEGLFLLAFPRDARGEAVLEVRAPGQPPERRTLAIAARPWDIQRIDGLPERMVNPLAVDLERIRADNDRIRDVRRQDSPFAGFAGGFAWPARGPISGVFGSQRILNGEPRAPHNGVDVAAPLGTPVGACAEGVVALVDEGMYLTGATVMVDHGHGLTSVYAHLSAIAVRAGERVARGQTIGRLGASGRVTAAHLHWGMTLFDVHIDPARLVPPMAAN